MAVKKMTLRTAISVSQVVKVRWIVQPPGVTVYTTASGHKYRVRNAGEMVEIYPEDRPELVSRGYIAPQE